MGGGSEPPSHAMDSATEKPLSLRVLTHNIRYATKSPFKGEELWEVRKPKVCAQLLYHTRDLPTSVVFLQEVLINQLNDIHKSLATHTNDIWTFVGRGREDGKQAGEFSPIFYKRDAWNEVPGSYQTIWLNETGSVGRKGWDAASVRILVTVVLEHIPTRRRVLFLNTHLDDQGTKSRQESAKIILKQCMARREKYDVDAVVLGGDLNSEADGDAYPVIANFAESGVVDIRMLANGEEVYGEESTFTDFSDDAKNFKRIDFLFLGSKKDNLNPNVPAYAVLPNRFEDGVYLSDHRAVIADLVIH